MSGRAHRSIEFSLSAQRGALRQNFEDALCARDLVVLGPTAHPYSFHCPLADGFLAGVFDGVGGGPDGEVASSIGASQAALWWSKLEFENAKARCAATLAHLSEAVRERNLSSGVGNAASTAAIVGIHDDQFVVGNMGDSAVFAVRDGLVIDVSQRHVGAGGVLTQFLGARVLEPWSVTLGWTPSRLLLTTDGLMKHLNEEMIDEILLGGASIEEVRELLHGAADDCAVVLISVADDVDLAPVGVSEDVEFSNDEETSTKWFNRLRR